jgi:uncharacterized lipoprotein YddW (UPF0748 family)
MSPPRRVEERTRSTGRVVAFVATLLVAALLAVACGDDGGPDTSSPTSGTAVTTAPSTTSSSPPTSAPTTSTTTATAPTPVAVDPPASAVWVHLFDDTLKTPEGVEAVLDEVADAGIEAVIAQVIRRHDAYYRSGYLPATPDPGLAPGFDVLAALVEGGHARGLQIHAWFVVGHAYHHQYDGLDLPPDMAWVAHGPDSADSWMTVGHDGTVSREFFDVGLDAVHDHVAAIVEDLASRYEVDGVHLDYVRYDAQHLGYHPDALAAFARETGRTDRPSPSDRQWSQWRTDRTAELIARATATLERVRPGALLSAAVIAGGAGPSSSPGGFAGTRAAVHYFQDWPRWLAEDRVDFVLAMAYTRESNVEHAGWFRDWVRFAGELAERYPGRVGVGVGAYLNPVDAALAQVALVRDTTGMVGIYSYQQDSVGPTRGEVLARCCR